jgi:hypothetical protein
MEASWSQLIMNASHRYGVEAHRSEGLPDGRIMADKRQMNTSSRANLPLSWAFDKRAAATMLREY